MIEYIQSGRVKIDKSKHPQLTTVHDPCNYTRKSQMAMGKSYGPEIRWITQQLVDNYVDMYPADMNNYCCGAGGGAWAMPYEKERIYYGRLKAKQIQETEAELVVAPCHNCRDQILKSLTKEYNLGIETMYLWELLAESLIIEPWSEEEIEKATALRDAQFERDGVVLEEMEEEEE
jgi:dimethylglycine catabolism B